MMPLLSSLVGLFSTSYWGCTRRQYLSDLRQYLTDIAAILRISPEDTRQLTADLADARRGAARPDVAAQAKQRLIEGHLWLVISLVKRSPARLCTLSPLDLVQEGTFGLFRALDRFDFASGGNFTAYAAATIRYAILDALPMEETIRVSYDLSWRNRTDDRIEALRAFQPLSLDTLYGEEDCAVGDLLAGPPLVLPDREGEQQRPTTHAQVEALLARLTPREQQMLRLRYGLDEADGRAHSFNAIAQQFGLDASTVYTFIKRALQRLRAPQETEEASPRSLQQQAQRRQEQVQRLEAACAELVTQGIPVSVRALARLAHVDKEVIRPFVSAYWERQDSEQERLTKACAALEVEGLPITMAGLCSGRMLGARAPPLS